eukprot:4794445-Heterocapsa_arctica.AAC.1
MTRKGSSKTGALPCNQEAQGDCKPPGDETARCRRRIAAVVSRTSCGTLSETALMCAKSVGPWEGTQRHVWRSLPEGRPAWP